jgi:hypothetical protein
MGDQINKNVIGGTCSTIKERRGEMYAGFCWGKLREREHL